MSSYAALLSGAVQQLKLHACTPESAEQEALALLAFSAGISKESLVTRLHEEAPITLVEKFSELILRRFAHYPFAYLLGNEMFLGRMFSVSPDTLIPRPATEAVVQEVIAYAQSLKPMHQLAFVDVGTGSGCIAVSLALAFPDARVLAYDVSEPTLTIARRNAHTNSANNIFFSMADRLTSLSPDLREHFLGMETIIVANLPYIPTPQIPLLTPDVREHEPYSALDGGPDGMRYYRDLLDDLHLYPCKALAVEFFAEQFEIFTALALQRFPSAQITSINNLGGVTVGALVIFS